MIVRIEWGKRIMNAKIKARYDKCPARYDIYVNGQRIKNGKTIELASDGTIELLEKNPFLSGFWVFLTLFNLICAFFGSFDDFNDTVDKQKRVTISYGAVKQDTLTLIISDKTHDVRLDGVDYFVVSQVEELRHPVIKKRIKIARSLLIIIPIIIILAIAAVVIAVVLLKK